MQKMRGWLAVSALIECLVLIPLLADLFLPSITTTLHAAPPSTSITETTGPGNLGTQVLPPSGNVYGITGGTSIGPNLFHSFNQFTIGPGDIAQFQTTTLLQNTAVHNILGRVTGGAPSSIFGTIDSATFYPAANLFLINPAGILFGPTATLNVGGSVAFSTANYLKLAEADGTNAGIFHADPLASSVLTSAPVAAFGFLGSTPASITVQGSHLSVADGSSLTLVGGDITIQSGVLEDTTVQTTRLSATGGQIDLASVASAGEIVMPTISTASILTSGVAPTSFGTINLAEGSVLDVGGSPSGIIRIRSGQLLLDSAQLTAVNSGDIDGPATAVRIDVDDLTTTNGAQILTIAAGTGAAGATEIHATNSVTISGIDPTGTLPGYFNDIGLVASGIFSDSSGGGTPGAVSITSPHITVADGGRIHSVTSSDANGAPITLTADTLNVTAGGAILSTSGLDFQTFEFRGSGNAGNILITAAESISVSGLDSSGTPSSIQSQSLGAGTGGAIHLTSPSIAIAEQGAVATTSFDVGPAGDITLTTGSLTITGGGGVTTSGSELAPSGSILISADNGISVMGTAPDTTPSRIVNENGGSGGTGSMRIDTKDLLVSDGARIRSDTFLSPLSSSNPKLVIHATDSITVAGDRSDITVMNFLSDIEGMQLTTRTFTMTGPSTVSTLTFGEGNGGPLTITAENISLSGGSQITSSSQGGSGRAGSVTIQGPESPANALLISDPGSGIFTDTRGGSGAGGNIFINSNTVTLQNGGTLSAKTSGTEANATGGSIAVAAPDQVSMTGGASITASSTGPADAGNIAINAGRQLDMHDSSIKTEAAQASGGNIDIQAIDRVSLVNSTISTSVLGGSGSGGNITIDPTLISLANSNILAQAILGSGGNIRLVAGLLLVDPTSLISASSEFGQSGTIQSPTSNLAGSVGSLPSSVRQGQTLQTQRCAVLSGGESSSFIIAGRDTVPTEPGGWMVSSIDTLATGERPGARGDGAMARGERSGARGERDGSLSGLSSLSSLSGSVRTGIPSHQIDQIDQIDEPPILSLRRLTPAGFLTQHFAEGETSGCRS